MEDFYELWKDKEPAEHGSTTPPLMLARQLGDSIRRLDLLLDVPDVKYSLVEREQQRSADIQMQINASLNIVAAAIRDHYKEVFHTEIETMAEIYGNLPYFCRKISIFISGETPPW